MPKVKKGANVSESTDIEVTVTARIYPQHTMFFRQGMAEATTSDGHELELSANINGDSVIVSVDSKLPTGCWYVLGAREIFDAILAVHAPEVPA